MGKAVFITPHTIYFAAGIILVAAIMFILPLDRNVTPGDASMSIIAIMVLLCALFEAALFSLGCAWGGVTRLPRPGWAFIAGVLIALGFVALQMLMSTIPAPVDLESHKRQGLYTMMRTMFVLVAPIISGLLCAWTWRRIHN